MNTAISEMLIDITVKPTSRGTQQHGLLAVHAGLDMPRDVFEHDDGVVDNEARRDRQRHQRQIVERKFRDDTSRERANQRKRNRYAWHECSTTVSQK